MASTGSGKRKVKKLRNCFSQRRVLGYFGVIAVAMSIVSVGCSSSCSIFVGSVLIEVKCHR